MLRRLACFCRERRDSFVFKTHTFVTCWPDTGACTVCPHLSLGDTLLMCLFLSRPFYCSDHSASIGATEKSMFHKCSRRWLLRIEERTWGDTGPADSPNWPNRIFSREKNKLPYLYLNIWDMQLQRATREVE